MTFYHGAPNIHVPGFDFIKFFVHARNSMPYILGPSAEGQCLGPRTESLEKSTQKNQILSFSTEMVKTTCSVDVQKIRSSKTY